ncbi:hypothetical protein C2U70_16185 [Bradyrhizobium guangdongense]|uniref:hypothetical protein n=1 Tax=Bradyrhizobium guangdongense TaxID=1325090 RepID=UPI00112BFD13|nr:hypothetical protein [Bradyrhizobium guangdongense]TPQ34884.1 hypothetical protein C2U70_16185 [Bradyrhizobium guangdongense]
MKWIRERDALIAQTMAFVQSVTGRKDGFPRADEAPAVPAATVDIVSYVAIERTVEIEAPQTPAAPAPQPFEVAPPRIAGDFRAEIQGRVANFRKHQERFEREREEYCATTLAKLRADIRDAASPPSARK